MPGFCGGTTRQEAPTVGRPGSVPVTFTAPSNGAVTIGSTTVTGTTTPGTQVTISSDQPGTSTDSATVVATAAPSGQFEGLARESCVGRQSALEV